MHNLLYGEMKDMEFFTSVSKGWSQWRDGIDSHRLLFKWDPEETGNSATRASPSHPPSFFFFLAPLPAPPLACCAIIAWPFNKASRWTTGLQRCHFCKLRWQETSHYGRCRRATGKDPPRQHRRHHRHWLTGEPSSPRKVIKKRITWGLCSYLHPSACLPFGIIHLQPWSYVFSS